MILWSCTKPPVHSRPAYGLKSALKSRNATRMVLAASNARDPISIAIENSTGLVVTSSSSIGSSGWSSQMTYDTECGQKFFVKTSSRDFDSMFKGESLGLQAMYGGTPQPNGWDTDWIEFFKEKRLLHQVNLTGNKTLIELGEIVAKDMERLFDGVDVKPSVLHGDLWSGNIASVCGEPAIFDPATYYGHSEAEFGMSWCAGFSDSFYKAYFEINPKQEGFEKRRDLYKVYHILNHYNLFGSGYLGESRRLLERLVKAVSG